ncbi:YciI family protein [Bacillus sp. 03113]|uniref:YciI family protein n=1 Tax=Bacillus sp. 03113 TaxID=2578211 RepID=UPI0011412D69|nr:YciI family protein [Bacillus sp. 03113]
MFLVLLKYEKPIKEVEKYLEEHAEFLDKYYSKKKFIFSGRRNPRIGGVILVNTEDQNEIQEIIQEDPFHVHGIAHYEMIEFFPTKYDENFRSFVENK